MKRFLAVAACLALVACVNPEEGTNEVPPLDTPFPTAAVISQEVVLEGTTSYVAAETPTTKAEELNAELAAEEQTSAEEEAAQETTETSAGGVLNLSDENDFSAVSERQSIESDAERLARNRDLYTIVQPKDLPQRPGQVGPNIVAYALATNNPVGEPLYERFLLFMTADKYRAKCAAYASPDLAQIAFLEAGGPENDKHGLDPDGDGFACAWDPTVFRSIRSN